VQHSWPCCPLRSTRDHKCLNTSQLVWEYPVNVVSSCRVAIPLGHLVIPISPGQGLTCGLLTRVMSRLQSRLLDDISVRSRPSSASPTSHQTVLDVVHFITHLKAAAIRLVCLRTAVLTPMRQARALKDDERVRQYQEAQAARESRDRSARRQHQKATEAAIKEVRRAHVHYSSGSSRNSGAVLAAVQQVISLLHDCRAHQRSMNPLCSSAIGCSCSSVAKDII